MLKYSYELDFVPRLFTDELYIYIYPEKFDNLQHQNNFYRLNFHSNFFFSKQASFNRNEETWDDRADLRAKYKLINKRECNVKSPRADWRCVYWCSRIKPTCADAHVRARMHTTSRHVIMLSEPLNEVKITLSARVRGRNNGTISSSERFEISQRPVTLVAQSYLPREWFIYPAREGQDDQSI